MSDKQQTPDKEQEQEDGPRIKGRPVTTGDMQEVGATTPEEVPERQGVDGEDPVHKNPGDQNSG